MLVTEGCSQCIYYYIILVPIVVVICLQWFQVIPKPASCSSVPGDTVSLFCTIV